MRIIDVILFGNLIQAIDPTLATSRVSAECAKDARDASESELRKSRINLSRLQKTEFNLHNLHESRGKMACDVSLTAR